MHLTFQLNQIVENSNGDSLNKDVLELMRQIVKKAKLHFQREEMIMEKYHLNDASAHMSEHATIIYKLNEMIDHYEAKRLYASQNIKNMILDWWINHTNTVDYRTFVLNVSEEQYKQLKEEAHHVQ
jgi:hemerythrin-like metal-binding protein